MIGKSLNHYEIESRLGAGGMGEVYQARDTRLGRSVAVKVLPEALPRAEEVQVDPRVLLFTLGVSILTGILFGLVPAIKVVRPDLQETLKEGGRGGSGTRHKAYLWWWRWGWRSCC